MKTPYLGLLLGLLMILILVFFVGKKAGAKPPEIVEPNDLNENGKTSKTNFNPRPLTDSIFNDVHGWHKIFTTRDEKAYYDLLALSNTDLAKVVNDWNRRYFTIHDNMTLAQAIKDEDFPYLLRSAIDGILSRIKIIEQLSKN